MRSVRNACLAKHNKRKGRQKGAVVVVAVPLVVVAVSVVVAVNTVKGCLRLKDRVVQCDKQRVVVVVCSCPRAHLNLNSTHDLCALIALPLNRRRLRCLTVSCVSIGQVPVSESTTTT